MRAFFSVYREDYDTDNRECIYSKVIETNWNIDRIEEHFQLFDLFRSELVLSNDLCFWDIFLYYADSQVLIEKIENIPLSKSVHTHRKWKSNFLMIEEFNPGNVDSPEYPNWNKYEIYSLSRFERGASSFGAFIVSVVENPFTQGIIINFVYDLIKYFARKAFNSQKDDNKYVYYLNIKNFYKNFSESINMEKSNFQITSIKRNKIGNFNVCVRTITGEKYVVKCNFRGNTISFYKQNI